MRTTDPKNWYKINQRSHRNLPLFGLHPSAIETRLRKSFIDALKEFYGHSTCVRLLYRQSTGRYGYIYSILYIVLLSFGIFTLVTDVGHMVGAPNIEVSPHEQRQQPALLEFPAIALNRRDKNKTFTLEEIESNLLAYGGLVSRTKTKFNMNFIKFLDSVDQETNVTNILLKLSPECGDMLVYCEWKDKSIPCRHMFATRMTPHGFCCLMNSRYAPEDSSRKPMYLHSHNYGTGLLVVVQEDVDDFMFLRRLGTDTEVIIFGGNQYPIQDSGGVRSFPAPKNYFVSVKLKTRRQEVSSGVIFDENLSGCLAHGPPAPLCLARCRRGAAAALCSCVPPALLPAHTDKVCTPEYLHCIVRHREILLQYFPDFSQSQGAAEEMSDSVDCRHCRPHCAHTYHEARLTRQRVDTGERYFLDQYTKKLVNYPNSTLVHIYFASDRQEFYSVGVTYRWFDFAIYISNHWMTIVGMGLINFWEVIYFTTFRWYHHYQRRKESMELTDTFKHL
ncbi:uncharacterized protein LOC123699932 [Colias croceus]|uniref:uncharacterized protein LOC123699932 n=1 Tax=Colias crocea TaxID=72248 RepID=UPI001E27F41D|nr:uncharacterized protein LOC123699932 [Colias croceus]